MSLIITSNRLSENQGTARGQLGTEKPADYKNFFRSPIEIEPDSEIAVESVKIERNGNIQLNDNSYFCHYWGRDEGESVGAYEDLNQISRNIPLNRGTYNFESFEKEIEDKMDAAYADPRIYGSNTVSWRTNASTGVPEGLNIGILQKGSASGQEVSGSLTAQTVYNLQAPNDENQESNQYTWDPGSPRTITKTGAFSTQFANASAVVQLKGRPFGLNQGRFDVTVVNASSQRWAVGLSRPQLQYRSQSTWNGNLDDVFNLDRNTEQHKRDGRAIIDAEGEEFYNGPYETYDYAVIQSEGVGQSEIMVVQRAYDDITGVSRMEELEYWNVPGGLGGITDRMSYSEFYASFDGVRFEGAGDEIKLYFKDKAKPTYQQVLGSNLEDKPGRSFTPIGDTSYALYPMFNLGNGSMTVTKYESNYANDVYRYPTFTTNNNIYNEYTPGDDMFSNEATVMKPGAIGPFKGIPTAPRELKPSSYSIPTGRGLVADNVVAKIDSSGVKYLWTSDAQDLATYGYVGIADNGVQFDHIITMNTLADDSTYNTLMPSQEFPNMSEKLGFFSRSLAIQSSGEGYVDGDGTRDITFRSPSSPALVNKSAFIRVPNLTHKSFNGAQSSLSKIVYQVPQFTNDGRQFGPLYFAPGEKTYIALRNPSSILLNDISVQFVEANEKVVDSFTGSSQVVFHIRKRK